MTHPFARPGLTATCSVALIILVCLGTWQVARLQWKTDLIALVDARMAETVPAPLLQIVDGGATSAREAEFVLTTANGVFVPGRIAHVFGTYGGQPGWFAFAPFQLLDGTDQYAGVILVNLGFRVDNGGVPDGPLALPPGVTQLEGRIRRFARRGLFTPQPNFDDGAFYGRVKADLASYFFPQTEDVDQVRDVYLDATTQLGGEAAPQAGTTRAEFSNRHLGYALTWYGLALCLLVIYVGMLRQPREPGASAPHSP